MSHAHHWTYFYVPGDAFRYCSCGMREAVDPDGKTRPVEADQRAFVESRIKKLEKSAALRTKPFGSLCFTIDRPKGTVKTWKRPDGSSKTFTYPVDYGYLPGHKAEDGEGLDFFVGDDPHGHLESFQKLKDGILDETKFLVGVTDAQRETIYALYGQEIWHRRVYRNMDELTAQLLRFRASQKPRYTLDFGQYGVMEKDAGFLDSLKGLLGRGRAAAPSAPAAHIPSAPKPPPLRDFIAAQPQAPKAPTLAGPAQPQVSGRPRPPIGANAGAATKPTTAAPSASAVSGPATYPAVKANTPVDRTPAKKSTTPVMQGTYGGMLTSTPEMQQMLKSDMRTRAALGARVQPGGGLMPTRNANSLGAHLLQNNPGAQLTPDFIQQTMRTPEFARTRQAYKGASYRTLGKLAMLQALGFKSSSEKFADITKHLVGEVMVAGHNGTERAFERVQMRSSEGAP